MRRTDGGSRYTKVQKTTASRMAVVLGLVAVLGERGIGIGGLLSVRRCYVEYYEAILAA